MGINNSATMVNQLKLSSLTSTDYAFTHDRSQLIQYTLTSNFFKRKRSYWQFEAPRTMFTCSQSTARTGIMPNVQLNKFCTTLRVCHQWESGIHLKYFPFRKQKKTWASTRSRPRQFLWLNSPGTLCWCWCSASFHKITLARSSVWILLACVVPTRAPRLR